MPLTEPGVTTEQVPCSAAVLAIPLGSNPDTVIAELCADQRFDLTSLVIDRPRQAQINPTSIRTRCDTMLGHCRNSGLDDRYTAGLFDSILSTEPDTARTLLQILGKILRGSSTLIIRVPSAAQPDFDIPGAFNDAVRALFGVRVETFADSPGIRATDILRAPRQSYADEGGLQVLEVLTCPDEDLAEAWTRWLQPDRIDDLRGFSLVAPILHERLLRIEFQHEETGRLAGIRRRAWYVNSLKLAGVTAVITTLRSIDVDVMFTGDLIDSIDADARGSVRAIEGTSLLIDPEDVHRAIEVLGTEHPELPADILRKQFIGARALTETKLELPFGEGRSIDLHWRWLPDRAANRVPLISEDVGTIEFEGSPVRALTPTARLIELITHSVRPAPRPAFITRVRTMELLDHHHEMIDWTRVQWACERLELSEHLGELIGSLPERTRSLAPVRF